MVNHKEELIVAGAVVTQEYQSTAYSRHHGPSESVYLTVENGAQSARLRISWHENGFPYEHDTFRQKDFGALASVLTAIGLPVPAHIVDGAAAEKARRAAQFAAARAEKQAREAAYEAEQKAKYEARVARRAARAAAEAEARA